MPDSPRVSVIIPAYNAEFFLAEAIESVLAQTYREFEIIVVDDGSTDGTHAIVEAFGDHVRYVYQSNQERAAARNHGARLARGSYLVFLDADDRLLPDMLASHVAVLDGNAALGLVAGGWRFVAKDGQLMQECRPWETGQTIDLPWLLTSGSLVIHGIALRRSAFETVQGFDTRYRGPEDIDLWLRLALAGYEMAWQRELVCDYRIHDGNSSRNIERHYRELRQAIDHVLASPKCPTEVGQLREEVLTRSWLGQAGRLYGVGDWNGGRQSLEQALAADALLRDSATDRLIETALIWLESVWNTVDSDLLLAVLQHDLGQVLGGIDVGHRVASLNRRRRFYEAARRGEATALWEEWAAVARTDLSWLTNRGAWSLLIRSFIAVDSER